MKHLKWLLPVVVIIISAIVLLMVSFSPQKTLAINDRVPDYRLRSITGQDVFFNDYRGKVVLINFWDTLCAPCVDELPFIQTLQDTYFDAGFRALSILTTAADLTGAQQIMETYALTYPLLVDQTGQLTRDFNAEVVPFTALVSERGVIRFIHVGYDQDLKVTLERQVKQLLEERRGHE